MKVWIKVLIGTVLGFGSGFAAGFFVHKKINDVQFEEVSEEEMAEIESIEAEKLKPTKLEKLAAMENIPTDPDELKKVLQGKVSYIQADAEAKAKNLEAWNTIRQYSDEENANGLPVEEEGFDEGFLEEIKDSEEDDWDRPPYQIDFGEFYNGRPEYDHITIEWYDEDNTFLDEHEDVIADIQTYIGTDIFTLFKDDTFSEDADVRFVRNEQYGSDYEIVRRHQRYRDVIGGEE